VEARPFALSPTDGFLRAQLFETHNEIVSQISMKLPETFSRRPHQVETRGCASIPLIYGNQTSAAIAAVQGFEAKAREFWRAVDEIDHSQRMLNSYSWHNAPANDRLARLGRPSRRSAGAAIWGEPAATVCGPQDHP
jgi:hypothetical protein